MRMLAPMIAGAKGEKEAKRNNRRKTAVGSVTGELDGLSRTRGYGEVTRRGTFSRQGTFSRNVTRGRTRVRLTRKDTDLIVLNNRRHVRWRLAALRWLRPVIP